MNQLIQHTDKGSLRAVDLSDWLVSRGISSANTEDIAHLLDIPKNQVSQRMAALREKGAHHGSRKGIVGTCPSGIPHMGGTGTSSLPRRHDAPSRFELLRRMADFGGPCTAQATMPPRFSRLPQANRSGAEQSAALSWSFSSEHTWTRSASCLCLCLLAGCVSQASRPPCSWSATTSICAAE